MPFRSFRTRAMLVLILACALVVLVLGGIWLYSTKTYIENNIYSTDIQDSRHMAESVNMYLNDITSDTVIIASNPDTITMLQNNDTASMAHIAGALKSSNPKPDVVVITDGEGNVRYATLPASLTSIKANSWYSEVAGNKEPFITGLYDSPALNEYAFAVVTPVKSNDTVIGRIMTVFTLENFQDSLKEHNLDPKNNIIVVDRNGSVISSNDLAAVNRNTDLSTYTPVQKVIRGASGVTAHSDAWDGQPRVSAYRPIGKSGWGVIVSTPLAMEYRPLYDQMFLIIGTLLFFIIMFSTVGYFASKYLTDPIVKLSSTMNRISAGDYKLRVKVDRWDEIGVLAGTFNTMMDKLEEAKARSDMYLDLMGHDINNMNQVALGYLELASGLIDSGDTIGKSRETLIKKPIGVLEESSNLISNVRKLQKARTEVLQVGTVDLNRTLSELTDRYSQVPGRNIKIGFERSGEPLVCANELIRDVFSNLIWNAIKHSDPGKPLAIRLKVDESVLDGKKYYKVSVEDNGPGIRDELKGKLFSRLARGDTKAKGSGLGLYLVKTLVDGFNGRVWVEDSVKGDHTKGARFVVMLPAATHI